MNLAEQREIGALIAAEDNRATSDPIFVVQQRRRVYGMDPQWIEAGAEGQGIEWIHDDEPDARADAETAARLEAAYDSDGEDNREGYRRVAFLDHWEWVQPFFTEAGANAYLAANRHNLKDPRVYVASAYRNREWQGARAIFKEAVPNPPPPSPASEGWTPPTSDQRVAARDLLGEYLRIAKTYDADALWIPEIAMRELCAALLKASPHFAPKVRVRVPSGYLVSSPLAQTHGVALGCAEADRQWIAALRQAGVEIEGEQ